MDSKSKFWIIIVAIIFSSIAICDIYSRTINYFNNKNYYDTIKVGVQNGLQECKTTINKKEETLLQKECK